MSDHEANDKPLTLEQLERMNGQDRAQLRARINSRHVFMHPETVAVVSALLDHLNPNGKVGQATRAHYNTWQKYYGLPYYCPHGHLECDDFPACGPKTTT